MGSLTDAVEMLVVFGFFFLIIKQLTEFWTRKRLIDKGMVDEKVKFLYTGGARGHALNNLKWGMILIGVGMAALLSYWFPDYIYEGGTVGLMLILGGLAFIIYYFMLGRLAKEEEQENGPENTPQV